MKPHANPTDVRPAVLRGERHFAERAIAPARERSPASFSPLLFWLANGETSLISHGRFACLRRGEFAPSLATAICHLRAVKTMSRPRSGRLTS